MLAVSGRAIVKGLSENFAQQFVARLDVAQGGDQRALGPKESFTDIQCNCDQKQFMGIALGDQIEISGHLCCVNEVNSKNGQVYPRMRLILSEVKKTKG